MGWLDIRYVVVPRKRFSKSIHTADIKLDIHNSLETPKVDNMLEKEGKKKKTNEGIILIEGGHIYLFLYSCQKCRIMTDIKR